VSFGPPKSTQSKNPNYELKTEKKATAAKPSRHAPSHERAKKLGLVRGLPRRVPPKVRRECDKDAQLQRDAAGCHRHAATAASAIEPTRPVLDQSHELIGTRDRPQVDPGKQLDHQRGEHLDKRHPADNFF
jgi:hypothetical protein